MFQSDIGNNACLNCLGFAGFLNTQWLSTVPWLAGCESHLPHHPVHHGLLCEAAVWSPAHLDPQPPDKMVSPDLIYHLLVLFSVVQILPQEHLKVTPSL